ncbi:ATP-dependent RNA helicase SrmB, partial [Xenorhabdus bovienii]|nr:ATP-dependent RNA helicase SrmB [Xenorhabdus bovienii]
EGESIRDFAERLLTDPVEIDAEPSRRERKKIQQFYYRADTLEHKTALLCNLLQQPDVTKSIVFVRKRERVREVVDWLSQAGIRAGFLE